MKWWVLTMFCVVALAAPSLMADDARDLKFWRRAKAAANGEHGSVLRAAERAMLGVADDRDLMIVRRGFVDLARGAEFYDPREPIALITLRREVGLSMSGQSEARLRKALSQPLPTFYRSLGLQQLSRLLTAEGRHRAAAVLAEQAVAIAWQQQQKAEALILLGWITLRQEEPFDAVHYFASAARSSRERRTLAAALVSEGYAHERAGDRGAAERAKRRGLAVARNRAQASGIGLFDGLGLTDEEREQVEQFVSAPRGDEDDLDP